MTKINASTFILDIDHPNYHPYMRAKLESPAENIRRPSTSYHDRNSRPTNKSVLKVEVWEMNDSRLKNFVGTGELYFDPLAIKSGILEEWVPLKDNKGKQVGSVLVKVELPQKTIKPQPEQRVPIQNVQREKPVYRPVKQSEPTRKAQPMTDRSHKFGPRTEYRRVQPGFGYEPEYNYYYEPRRPIYATRTPTRNRNILTGSSFFDDLWSFF